MPDTRPGALAGIEGRLPPEIAAKAEADGVAKAGQDGVTLLTLGVLGGAFIAFGAIFANVALTGAEAAMPFGMARVVAGFVFALGISMVLLGGAQIFTGDVLMVMAWASGRLALRRVLRAWALVWIGNLAGAVGTALLVFLAQHHLFGGGQVGVTALRTAETKAAPLGRKPKHRAVGISRITSLPWFIGDVYDRNRQLSALGHLNPVKFKAQQTRRPVKAAA